MIKTPAEEYSLDNRRGGFFLGKLSKSITRKAFKSLKSLVIMKGEEPKDHSIIYERAEHSRAEEKFYRSLVLAWYMQQRKLLGSI